MAADAEPVSLSAASSRVQFQVGRLRTYLVLYTNPTFDAFDVRMRQVTYCGMYKRVGVVSTILPFAPVRFHGVCNIELSTSFLLHTVLPVLDLLHSTVAFKMFWKP